MRFLVEWIEGAPNASAEERATLCGLQIMVGGTNACFHKDEMAGRSYDSVVVPAVHLAEGIATDWWSIFGGRDCGRSIWAYGSGFVLPCLSFGCDGSGFEVSGEQMSCENPGVHFWRAGTEVLPRADAEGLLSGFVEGVVGRLCEKGISGSEVQMRWERVCRSRLDPEEAAFCEAAGALGLDPYAIGDGDAEFIFDAGKVLTGVPLTEFLAGVSPVRWEARRVALASVEGVSRMAGARWSLPELRAVSEAVDGGLRNRRDGEGVWGGAYRLARAVRGVMGVDKSDCFSSVEAIAGGLGNPGFEWCEGLSGVYGVVSRGSEVRIHLRKPVYGPPWFENFNLARAIGDAVCFPGEGSSVVNGLHGAERQAAGRAFAAEFLAPVEAVCGMLEDGYGVGDVAGRFVVDPRVVQLQLDNRERIERACSGVL